ncbi:hypothetical protein BC830DRAFT_1076600 [Chytriomyces sp. MP71]|nr:hypothetical protein BC830DRAFT_1076600 [Chytriomyces sp. MP71]
MRGKGPSTGFSRQPRGRPHPPVHHQQYAHPAYGAGGGAGRARMELEYETGAVAAEPPRVQTLTQVLAGMQQQQHGSNSSGTRARGTADANGSASVRREHCAVVSLKEVHFSIAPEDIVEAVSFLNGTATPLVLPYLPEIEYDHSGRSTESGLWYIPTHADAIRVAHLLNGQQFDGRPMVVSVIAAPPAPLNSRNFPFSGPATGVESSSRFNAGVAGNGSGGRDRNKGVAVKGIEKKKSLLQRLGPKPVLARLGPKKDEVLNRLGPKLREPGILGRLGSKPGSTGQQGNKNKK